MRRICAGLRSCLLLVVALTVAVQPLARSLSLAHAANAAAAELQLVICTSHGTIVLEESGGNPPSKENPSCPWCGICAGPAGKLPAVATTQQDQFPLPLLVQHRVVVA